MKTMVFKKLIAILAFWTLAASAVTTSDKKCPLGEGGFEAGPISFKRESTAYCKTVRFSGGLKIDGPPAIDLGNFEVGYEFSMCKREIKLNLKGTGKLDIDNAGWKTALKAFELASGEDIKTEVEFDESKEFNLGTQEGTIYKIPLYYVVPEVTVSSFLGIGDGTYALGIVAKIKFQYTDATETHLAISLGIDLDFQSPTIKVVGNVGEKLSTALSSAFESIPEFPWDDDLGIKLWPIANSPNKIELPSVHTCWAKTITGEKSATPVPGISSESDCAAASYNAASSAPGSTPGDLGTKTGGVWELCVEPKLVAAIQAPSSAPALLTTTTAIITAMFIL